MYGSVKVSCPGSNVARFARPSPYHHVSLLVGISPEMFPTSYNWKNFFSKVSTWTLLTKYFFSTFGLMKCFLQMGNWPLFNVVNSAFLEIHPWIVYLPGLFFAELNLLNWGKWQCNNFGWPATLRKVCDVLLYFYCTDYAATLLCTSHRTKWFTKVPS